MARPLVGPHLLGPGGPDFLDVVPVDGDHPEMVAVELDFFLVHDPQLALQGLPRVERDPVPFLILAGIRAGKQLREELPLDREGGEKEHCRENNGKISLRVWHRPLSMSDPVEVKSLSSLGRGAIIQLLP